MLREYPRSLQIEGPSEVDEGGDATFQAIAAFADGSRRAVAPQWSIEQNLEPSTGLASISSAGVLSVPRVPWEWQITLRATYAGIATVAATREVVIRNSSGRLTGVEIEGPGDVTVGREAEYRAYATYDDGFRYEVTEHTGFYGGWNLLSAPPEVTIDGTGRMSVATTAPDTMIEVRTAFGNPDGATYSGRKFVRVRSWYLTIEGPSEVLEGDPEQVMAEGSARYQLVLHDTNGSRRNVTADSWIVTGDDRSSPSILSDGTFWAMHASADDEVEIGASLTRDGVRKRGSLPVTIRHRDVLLTGIRIVPPSNLDPAYGVKPGVEYFFRVRASFRGRSDLETPSADWSVGPAVPGSSITSGGRLVTGAPADDDLQIRVTYEYEGISRSASYSMIWMPVTRLTIEPPSTSVQPLPVRDDQTAQFRARAYLADGTAADVTPTWSLSRTDVATISASGLLTPRPGAPQTQFDVTAAYGTGTLRTASWPVVIRPRSIVGFRIVPADDPIPVRVGPPVQLRAEVEWEGGAVETVDAQWELRQWPNWNQPVDLGEEVSLSSDGRLTARWPIPGSFMVQAAWSYASGTRYERRRVVIDCTPPSTPRRITLQKFEMPVPHSQPVTERGPSMRTLAASLALVLGLTLTVDARAQSRQHEFVIPIELRDLHPDVRSAIVICELGVWSSSGDVHLRQERTIPVFANYSGTVTISKHVVHPTAYQCWLELQHQDGRRSAPLAPTRTPSTSTSSLLDPTTTSRLAPIDELAWARVKGGTSLHTRASDDLPLECVN